MPVVWITGGARRIGRGLALRFAERGFDVAFTYNTSQAQAVRVCEEIEACGRRALAVRCDVSDAALLTATLEQFMADIGPADVVVSNAGVFPPARSVGETPLEDLEDTLRVNTLPLYTIAQVYERMCRTEGRTGRIISIGSLGAFEIWRGRIPYNVSKHALHTLVQALARALAPMITVNTVAPGAIRQPEDPTENDTSLVDVSRIPMGRYGTVDDIFDAVWFFATASSYCTGQVLSVDGGYRLTR
jgi:3-oxoacyl-[acyl-carrier protein] reductase/pteridine reductase